MNYTYMLRCCDGTYYTGWTNDLEKRLRAHGEGRGAKYTRSRTPVELVYFEEFETKSEAMRREAAIKRMTRREKEALAGQRSRVEALAGAGQQAREEKEGRGTGATEGRETE